MTYFVVRHRRSREHYPITRVVCMPDLEAARRTVAEHLAGLEADPDVYAVVVEERDKRRGSTCA